MFIHHNDNVIRRKHRCADLGGTATSRLLDFAEIAFDDHYLFLSAEALAMIRPNGSATND